MVEPVDWDSKKEVNKKKATVKMMICWPSRGKSFLYSYNYLVNWHWDIRQRVYVYGVKKNEETGKPNSWRVGGKGANV